MLLIVKNEHAHPKLTDLFVLFSIFVQILFTVNDTCHYC